MLARTLLVAITAVLLTACVNSDRLRSDIEAPAAIYPA